jgi:hypothetical protein
VPPIAVDEILASAQVPKEATLSSSSQVPPIAVDEILASADLSPPAEALPGSAEAASEQQQNPSPPPAADLELARAARQVAESVSNNDTDKFKQSKFFNLMRQLGSEQVVLDGHKFVEVGETADAQHT